MFFKRNNRQIWKMILLMALVFSLGRHAHEAQAAKANDGLPPYRPSGAIPGTELTYQGLTIDTKGVVTITIQNPGQGVNFTANFGFYNGKNAFMTGFSIQDFIYKGSSREYTLTLPNYKKLKQATHMKVLGRSGRTSGS